ncbi:MAG: hypothetical protein R3E97_15205 [Candidatus Eisenbacteria bacterium]
MSHLRTSGPRLTCLVLLALLLITDVSHAGQDLWTPIPYPDADIDYFHDIVATQDNLYGLVIEVDRTMRLFRRPHSGGDWAEIEVPGNPISVSVAGDGDSHLVATTREKKAWYSSDSGTSWIDRSNGLPEDGYLLLSLVFDSGWVYVAVYRASNHRHGIARSSDFGATWQFDPWCEDCLLNPIQQLETNGDPRYLWAAGNNGFFGAEMRRSTNWGATWDQVDVPFSLEEVPIDLVVDPVFLDNTYMLLPEPFLRFEGEESVDYTYPPFGTDANMNLAAPTWDPGTIYSSGQWSGGLVAVARSANFGYGEWEIVREGIPQEYPPHPYPNYWKNHLEPHPTEPRMYLAAFGMGLFARDFTVGPSAAPEQILVPGPLRFGAVLPNPTSGAVDLSLQVDIAGTVRLDVLDAQGRRLGNTRFLRAEPGECLLDSWASEALNSLPDGVYFLRASSSGAETVRRVCLVR